MSSMRLPSGSATNAIRTPGSGDGPGGHDRSGPACEGAVVRGVEVGHVERHVTVSLASAASPGVPGCGPPANRAGAATRGGSRARGGRASRCSGRVCPPQSVSSGTRPNTSQNYEAAASRSTTASPEHGPAGPRRRSGHSWTFSLAGSQVRYEAKRPDGSRSARIAARRPYASSERNRSSTGRTGRRPGPARSRGRRPPATAVASSPAWPDGSWNTVGRTCPPRPEAMSASVVPPSV